SVPVPIAFGNGAGAPLTAVFGAAIMAFFAVGFLKMSPFITNSGGFYVYVTAGLGKVLGLGASFLAQGSYFVLLLGSLTFSGYSLNTFVTGLGGPEIPWWAYSLLQVAIVGILGYVRVDVSAKVLTVLLLGEVAVVLAYNFFVMLAGGASGLDVGSSLDLHNIFSGNLGIALLIGVTCMGGFEATVIFREEVREPKKTIPRATFIFILITGLFYCITSWSMIQAVGSSTAQETYAADPAGTLLGTMETYMGRVGHDLVVVMLITSTLAANLAIHNITTRYAFNLGNDKILPRALSLVHPKHGSPYRASVTISIAAVIGLIPFIILNADPNFLFIQLLSSFSYAFMLMLTITSVAVAVFLNRRKPEGTTIWHRVIAPAAALIGIGLTLAIATTNLEALFGNTGP
ncbi:APC family permease, partial [Paenarthrobacter sp. NPDC089675]|uniref:APC family permease n=1 Tax=Paenarthrobacter TaxID=1742992 RepID=UPI00381C33C8